MRIEEAGHVTHSEWHYCDERFKDISGSMPWVLFHGDSTEQILCILRCVILRT